MDPALIDALADIGFAGGLIAILIGGYRGWWVWGPDHRRQMGDVTKDRDWWRNMALGNLRLAERATDSVPPLGPDDG